MSESSPKTPADTSESFSFFQLETEALETQSDTSEIALNEIPLTPPALIPQPQLDSDQDCACE